MELYPKHKCDAEYIELVRKRVSHTKRFALLHGIMFMVFIVMFLVLNRLVCQFQEIIPEVAEGVIIGLPIGVVMVFLAANVGFSAAFAARHLKGGRTENLMLKFHDELREQETSNREGGADPAGQPKS